MVTVHTGMRTTITITLTIITRRRTKKMMMTMTVVTMLGMVLAWVDHFVTSITLFQG
jgi:hypothetical protein